MTTQIKILLGLLLAAAIGLGITFFSGNPDPLIPETGTEGSPTIDDDDPANDLRGEGKKPGGHADERVPVRVKAEGGTASGSTYEQGVRGILTDEYDQPIEGAQVFLMPGMGLQSLKMFKLHQEGVRFAPLAETVTKSGGAFRLGIKEHREGKQYEVKILHDDFCDRTLPNIIPQPLDWWDLGNVKMKSGVTVFGRVTTDTGVPIPNAIVTAKDGSGTLNITPPPGREDGKFAKTNTVGDYEIKNLDSVQIFAVSAMANDFAKEEKSQLQLSAGKRHQLDFQLSPGKNIGGTVVDPQGKAIKGAKVTVAALSQKSQQTETATTNQDGYFVAHGLKVGVYTVMVEAEGYLTADEKPIPAGQTDLTITLERTGIVIVTVLDKNGDPQQDFHCNLKAAFDGENNYGNPLHSIPVKGVKDGSVTITGVKPMAYVAEVFAKDHAKNFSDRFTITAGQVDAPRVTVKLNEGGVIHGFVKNSKGKPIKGVKIKTMPNGLVENPFTLMFQVPYTITKVTQTSSINGEFRFTQLYSGQYQLKFDHPSFCSEVVKGIEVQSGETSTVGDIYITRGCEVSGIACLNGKAVGQVRIHVSSVSDEKNPVQFSCEAVSDNEGKFLLSKRLPPGKYQVMAAQNVQANPLIMMVQFNKSKKVFHIALGLESHALDVQIQSIK